MRWRRLLLPFSQAKRGFVTLKLTQRPCTFRRSASDNGLDMIWGGETQIEKNDEHVWARSSDHTWDDLFSSARQTFSGLCLHLTWISLRISGISTNAWKTRQAPQNAARSLRALRSSHACQPRKPLVYKRRKQVNITSEPMSFGKIGVCSVFHPHVGITCDLMRTLFKADFIVLWCGDD